MHKSDATFPLLPYKIQFQYSMNHGKSSAFLHLTKQLLLSNPNQIMKHYTSYTSKLIQKANPLDQNMHGRCALESCFKLQRKTYITCSPGGGSPVCFNTYATALVYKAPLQSSPATIFTQKTNQPTYTNMQTILAVLLFVACASAAPGNYYRSWRPTRYYR